MTAPGNHSRPITPRLRFLSEDQKETIFQGVIEVLERTTESYHDSRWGRSIWSVKVYYWLAQAYDRAGRPASAKEQYERFLHLWRNEGR